MAKTKTKTKTSNGPSAPASPPGRNSVPDRRLSSLFAKRTSTATTCSIGMLSSYPPVHDGVADFAASLRTSLIDDQPKTTVGVVRVSSGLESGDSPEVIGELTTSDGEEAAKAAAARLSAFDTAVIQYDPDTFGGLAGEQVLHVMDWILIPTVVVVHVIPTLPLSGQGRVLAALVDSADAVVALSEAARQRLIAGYGAVPRKTMVIPHGAHPALPAPPRVPPSGRRRQLLTWATLEPGRGIESVLEALAALKDTKPALRYTVAGQVAAGDAAYRASLTARARALHITHMVDLAGGDSSAAALRGLFSEADIVVVPDDSRSLTSSAALVAAIASGTPVVATRFPHAEELLAGGHGGLLVDHDNPRQMADAITRILTEPGLSARLTGGAADLAGELSWPNVAGQYRKLFDALLRRPSQLRF